VRLAVANENVPGMVSQITAALAAAGLNIEDLLNKARDKYAYTLIGLKADVPLATLQLIRSIKGVLSARIGSGKQNIAIQTDVRLSRPRAEGTMNSG
jgi:D-3-phosphoglycerate dehydrogenase